MKKVGVTFVTGFLAILLSGCSSQFRSAGQEIARGSFEEAEKWWAEKKPVILEEVKGEASRIANEALAKGQTHIEERAEEARQKQAQGIPLTQTDKIYLWLAVLSPLMVALTKAGLRYARGIGDPLLPTPKNGS